MLLYCHTHLLSQSHGVRHNIPGCLVITVALYKCQRFFLFSILCVYLDLLPSSHVSFSVLVIVVSPLFFFLQGVVEDC